MGVVWNDINKASRGGTEFMMRQLEALVPMDLLDECQIISSRMRGELDPTKIRILWCHDTEDDPEVSHLAKEGWRKFHKIVFVSNHQMQGYIRKFNIPWSRCIVIQNAITPIKWQKKKEDGPIRLVYSSTPQRGLNILYAAFDELCKRRDDVTLDVFSSFKLYGWEDRDTPFQPLFEALQAHPRITYHGAVPNDELRDFLRKEAHVFAYPSIWVETSCICLLEAMSADLVCVHSNLGALYETAANWTVMYPYHEDPQKHAGIFLTALEVGVEAADRRRKDKSQNGSNTSQKNYADLFYNWETRAKQWESLIRSLLPENRAIETSAPEFVYRVG